VRRPISRLAAAKGKNYPRFFFCFLIRGCSKFFGVFFFFFFFFFLPCCRCRFVWVVWGHSCISVFFFFFLVGGLLIF
jgi:hypothetical protein